MTRGARNFAIALVALVVLVISLLWTPHGLAPDKGSTDTSHVGVVAPERALPEDTLKSSPTAQATQTQNVQTPVAHSPQSTVPVTGASDKLIIPVQGIAASKLTDTYTQARSGGRKHDAIDIMAPHNSVVLAAAPGVIKRFFQSKLGGTTIYQLSLDSHTVYYYAHLDHYAAGLAEGQQVKQGQVIGYVGDTGDAGPGNYHLHFAIWKITDPKKFWDGENINPYPILRTAE